MCEVTLIQTGERPSLQFCFSVPKDVLYDHLSLFVFLFFDILNVKMVPHGIVTFGIVHTGCHFIQEFKRAMGI
ncbi:hypothetical protein AXX12_16575 [Anaerosporomusa subterranea]|uniref:Uncharacterized protein n=1 Tax=Anaerosporomusa subterranea TaxID=1794912 RepID=A0A154BLP5_ANASB|nr:hypothetical protein AXX12_16575 [Anaerosporomusa subterranea]